MAAFIGNQNAGPRFHAFTAVIIVSTSFPEANIPIAAAYKPIVQVYYRTIFYNVLQVYVEC